MSRPRIMFRLRPGPGRFALAGLPVALLVLLCLTPSTTFARTGGQAEARSLLSELNTVTAVTNKAGVSIVRLSATYSASGHLSITCTGLGVLIASQMIAPQHYTNWVLTDNNLISSKMSVCGQAKGTDLTLSALNIWASSTYAGANGKVVQLAKLTCQVVLVNVACGEENAPPTDPLYMNADGYTLVTFQSSAGEPYLEQAPVGSSASVSIGLIKSAGAGAYPSKVAVSGAAETDFLTPHIVSSSPPGNTSSNGAAPQATSALSNASTEGGTPELNDQGQLVGIWVNNGTGGYTSLSVTNGNSPWQAHNLTLLTPAASPQNCTVASCWLRGIDEYNQGPTHYSTAHLYLLQAFALNRSFVGAQTFDALTNPASTPDHSQGHDGQSGGSASVFDLLNQYATIVLAAGAVVVLILVVVIVLMVRARIHRRKLAVMGNEWKIAHQTAEQEVLQKKAQAIASPPPPPPQAAPYCPNCRTPVQVSDSICPNCRFPLAPTASGLGVRLIGNTPVGLAPPRSQDAAIPLASITRPPQRETQPVLLPNAKPVHNPALHAVIRKKCPRCGQVVDADTIDCPACHYRLNPPGQTVARTDEGMTPVAENRTVLQFAQLTETRDAWREAESRYALAEERLRNLWNRVG